TSVNISRATDANTTASVRLATVRGPRGEAPVLSSAFDVVFSCIATGAPAVAAPVFLRWWCPRRGSKRGAPPDPPANPERFRGSRQPSRDRATCPLAPGVPPTRAVSLPPGHRGPLAARYS